MPTAAQVLGKFAAGLSYPDLPQAVVNRANDCFIDAVAVAAFGAQFTYTSIPSRICVRLKDGREYARLGESFRGMPSDPLSGEEPHRKFMLLAAGAGEAAAARLIERLEHLEA